MKRHLFSLFAVFAIIILLDSCGAAPEKKLIGTWKVDDVQTDFNEQETTPEMLAQLVDMEKQTYFRFMNDSIMVIISNNNTHEAHWSYDEENQTILYFFEGMETRPNELGVLIGDEIVSESERSFGKITTIYSKEKD